MAKGNGRDEINPAIMAGGVPVIQRIQTLNIETTLPTGIKVRIEGLPSTFSIVDEVHLIEVFVSFRHQMEEQRANQGGGLVTPTSPLT